jgi:hypothetical protein
MLASIAICDSRRAALSNANTFFRMETLTAAQRHGARGKHPQIVSYRCVRRVAVRDTPVNAFYGVTARDRGRGLRT